MTAQRCFCTIVSASHVPFARALGTSLASAGNRERLHVLVTDLTAIQLPQSESVTYYSMDQLRRNYPDQMRYYFDAFELCNVLKPFFVAHLLHELEATDVIYLDSDIYVTGSFQRVWDTPDSAALTVTPHHFAPPPLETFHSREPDVVDLGIINGGFALWRAGARTDRILLWMSERFPIYGFCDPMRRMYVDQKLLPLLLVYFPETITISRDPGLNIAYWNAHERPVRPLGPERWAIGEQEVVFFHLSGFRKSNPHQLSAYLTPSGNAAYLRRSPWWTDVLAVYARIFGNPTATPPRPYSYDTYKGIELNPRYRRLLFERGELSRSSPDFWRIWFWHRMRMLKRLLTGIRPLS